MTVKGQRFSMNVRLNICACLCVPVVEYVHASCIVPPFFLGHLAFLKAIDEAHKKSYFTQVYCFAVVYQYSKRAIYELLSLLGLSFYLRAYTKVYSANCAMLRLSV